LLDDPRAPGGLVLVDADDEGRPGARAEVAAGTLAAEVERRERAARPPRWVWDDTSRRYPPLLAAGVRVDRCHDLRLCHAILRRSALSTGSELAAAPAGPWDLDRPDAPSDPGGTLFGADLLDPSLGALASA